MKNIIVAIGSNQNAEANMRKAKRMLEQLLESVTYSEALWTDAIGIQADRFLNCLAKGGTLLGYDELNKALKRIERLCGTTTEQKRKGMVAMDLDILLYDNQPFHADDWERPYIRRLMDDFHSPQTVQ